LEEGNWLDEILEDWTRENHYDPYRRHALSLLPLFCFARFFVQRSSQRANREDIEDSRPIGSIGARRGSERYPPRKNSLIWAVADVVVTQDPFRLAWGTIVIEYDGPTDISQ